MSGSKMQNECTHQLQNIEGLMQTRTPAFLWYPPPPHDYPYDWVILDPKSKEDKLKVTKFKKNLNFFNFETNITCDTPSEVAWYDVQIWNGSHKYCWRYRADTILSTDGQTDGRTGRQTDKVKPVYPPFNFVEAEGIMIPTNNSDGQAYPYVLAMIVHSDKHEIVFYIIWIFLRLCNHSRMLIVK